MGDPDGDTFSEIGGTLTANTNGNAYLKNYVLQGNQVLFARTSNNKKTNRFTIDSAAAPGTCPVAGALTSSPTIVTPGSTVAVLANFATDQKGKDITLYQVVDGVDPDAVVGAPQVADQYGNTTFSVKVDAEMVVRAATSPDPAKCTKPLTITPREIDPANFPNEQGSLAVNPADVRLGEQGRLTANFASSLAGKTVTFFHKVPGEPETWESIGSAKANSSGDATVIDFLFKGPESVFGLTDDGVRTSVEDITPTRINEITTGPVGDLGKNVLYVMTDKRKIPTKKGVEDPGTAAWSIDGGSTLVGGSDLSKSVFDLETLAVRGNTTANLSKKPYKLKFMSKQKPFGLKSDKTWVLLANYNDRSLVRSFAGFDLGSKLNGLAWTSKGVFTELFVDGKYQGSYQLIQSIKIDKDRVNISKTTGQIIEFDPWWREDGVPGMEGKGVYARLDYSWKDPDEFKPSGDPDVMEGLTPAKVKAMKDKIRKFESVLYGPNVTTGSATKRNWSTYKYTEGGSNDWTTYLDLNSAVDHYLMKEFTKDTDSDMYRSNYFYTNDVNTWADSSDGKSNKFFMGPVWDFDRSAGARDSSTMPELDNPKGWWIRGEGQAYHNTAKIHWFTQLIKDKRFLAALKTRWAETKGIYAAMSGGSAAGNGSDTVSMGLKAIGRDDAAVGMRVVANDKARWPNKSDRLSPRRSVYSNFPDADTKASSELGWLRDWYNERYKWMDSQLD
ncbi:MAG: CotH kinase family protein [Aeromicrobium sp.]